MNAAMYRNMLDENLVQSVLDLRLGGKFIISHPKHTAKITKEWPWDNSVMLVHASEAIPVLNRLSSEHPDRVFFKGVFRSGRLTETTICNICLRPTQQPLCNFTDPRTLVLLQAKEPKLGVNMKVYIPASGPASVPVLPKNEGLQEFDMHTFWLAGPFIALDYSNNILVKFRCHGPPIRYGPLPIRDLHYIHDELDGITGGPNNVVVFCIWAHLTTFPMELYIRRLQNIRRAVVRLLDRAPGTKVIIRTGNPQELFETYMESDWCTLQRDRVLRAMFKRLNVHLIDAWEMVQAHYFPHNLHPDYPIIKNMMDLLFSYICPQ
ncbi:NXPE family member 3-like [Centropristis striata]|uniref:NXPE family member 3-like n=1 Tax=Centropristis striata TaxID=184440 RepID=UPI0027E145AE|nr:NXPE family member 3-like [Centropristis striata]